MANGLRNILGETVGAFGRQFGLPELGISEAIGGGAPPGARPIGPETIQSFPGVTPAFAPGPIQGPTRQEAVPGPGGAFPIAGGAQQAPAVGPLGGGFVPTGAPAGIEGQLPLEQLPQAPGGDSFDAAIAPALQALQQGEEAIRADVQSQLRQATQAGEARKGQARGEERRRLQAFGTQRQQQTQRGESAIAEARRQASELQRGIQARFGGTTGTGRFASEVLGAQALRNIAGNRQALQNTLGQIGIAEGNVRDETARLVDQIDTDTASARENLQNSLRSSLADIAGQRGELQSRKAELRLRALQNFQQLLAQVNARNAAFKQQIFNRAQQTAQRLTAFRDSAIQNFQAQISPFEGTQITLRGQGTPQEIAGAVQGIRGQFPTTPFTQQGAVQGVGQAPLSPDEELLNL